MPLTTYATYCIGSSHENKGLVVQDRATATRIDMPDGASIDALFLADGHGNECHFRSHTGAELALEAAREAVPYIAEVLQRRAEEIPESGFISRGVAAQSANTPGDLSAVDPHFEAAARMFFLRINTLWAKKVLAHWNANPTGTASLAGAARAYGCTLLGAFCTDRYWFAFQLGDGAIIGLNADGSEITPIPSDSRCAGNTTTSLCRQGAHDYRYAYGRKRPAALMLCSDGLQECYENDAELARMFLGSVVAGIHDDGIGAVSNELAACLPQLSRDFTGDDMSVAFWVDPEQTEDIIPALTASNLSYYKANLADARARLDDCNKTIADLERQIYNLRALSENLESADAGIVRKDSVLATLKRQQRQLLDQIDSLNLNIENLSNG